MTDFTLRATKVAPQALSQTMSKLGSRKILNLAGMREDDKVHFLNAIILQVGLFGKTIEDFDKQFSTAKEEDLID